jgi:hypothetical protein
MSHSFANSRYTPKSDRLLRCRETTRRANIRREQMQQKARYSLHAGRPKRRLADFPSKDHMIQARRS